MDEEKFLGIYQLSSTCGEYHEKRDDYELILYKVQIVLPSSTQAEYRFYQRAGWHRFCGFRHNKEFGSFKAIDQYTIELHSYFRNYEQCHDIDYDNLEEQGSKDHEWQVQFVPRRNGLIPAEYAEYAKYIEYEDEEHKDDEEGENEEISYYSRIMALKEEDDEEICYYCTIIAPECEQFREKIDKIEEQRHRLMVDLVDSLFGSYD